MGFTTDTDRGTPFPPRERGRGVRSVRPQPSIGLTRPTHLHTVQAPHRHPHRRTSSSRRNSMPYESLIVEKRGRVLYVTMNRPESLNARNRQLGREVDEAFLDFHNDDETWI